MSQNKMGLLSDPWFRPFFIFILILCIPIRLYIHDGYFELESFVIRLYWEPSGINAEYISSFELLILLFFMTIPSMIFDISTRSKDFQASTKSLIAIFAIITIVLVGIVVDFIDNYDPWFFYPISYEYYWLFYEGLSRIPAVLTLALLLYVIIPLALREKNRLQQITQELPRREYIKYDLIRRMNLHSPKLLVGLLFVILFIVPSAVLYSTNRYSFDFSYSTILFSFNYYREGIVEPDRWNSVYINIVNIPSIMMVLYPNLLRILFTHRLLLWRRGKSSKRSVIVLGIIGEIWAYFFAPMSIPQENLWFDFSRTMVPIPILLIIGLLVIGRSMRYPVNETEFDVVFLKESPIVPEQTIIQQSGMEEFVEVPFAYSFTSRLKNSRLYPFKERNAVLEED